MKRLIKGLGCLAMTLAAGAAWAAPTSPTKADQCFRSEDYQAFRPVDDHAFNIRVNVRDYYRIEVQGSCPELDDPSSYLITTVRGSDYICGPLDWDLKIGESGANFAVPCIVKSQTKLTPDQVAALPKGQKP